MLESIGMKRMRLASQADPLCIVMKCTCDVSEEMDFGSLPRERREQL